MGQNCGRGGTVADGVPRALRCFTHHLGPEVLFGILCMAYKRLLFRSSAREKILHGAALVDAVRVTLGPKSVRISARWCRRYVRGISSCSPSGAQQPCTARVGTRPDRRAGEW